MWADLVIALKSVNGQTANQGPRLAVRSQIGQAHKPVEGHRRHRLKWRAVFVWVIAAQHRLGELW